MESQTKFYVGQIVHHQRFDYRGVIVDVDPEFSGSASWYEHVAKTRPAKDQPWYRILVDGAEHETYVAERHLENAVQQEPIKHPDVTTFFADYTNGAYVMNRH